MSQAPDATPEEEPAVAPPKIGAEAWKKRHALILDRNSAARNRSNSMNGRLTKKRPRG